MGLLLDRVRKSLFGEPVRKPASVNSKVLGAGTAFADLIEGVGIAVATTQRELDATSGHIATEMARTEVETAQAVVTEYDDNGNITTVHVVPGKTSALSIAVPPALSFKRVHLEGSFVASEFTAADHSNVNVSLVGAGFSTKGLGIGGPSVSASVVNVNTDVQSERTQDSSVASMSMTAEIRPKPVTALPKPPLVLRGPTLTLTIFKDLAPHNPITINPGPDATHPDLPPALFRRSLVIQVQLLKPDPADSKNPPVPVDGQTIAIDGGGLDWDVTDYAGADLATGAPHLGPKTYTYADDKTSGSFFITVSRNFASATEAKKDFLLRGSLNLINATRSVSL
jgi:hypothetical protein